MTCTICFDEYSAPFSFISDDCLCKDNHVFCIGCIYEYIRFTFQISAYDGKCKCPLDRKVYNLKSQFARGIFDAIELNQKAMDLLNQEEEISCAICEGIKLNPEKKYKRKEYLDHWRNTHFNNDDHLLLLVNKPAMPADNNFILLAPELVTPEAIEHQRWIEAQIRIDIENRNLTELRLIRLQNKEKRFDVLNAWRKLWADAKILKDTIPDTTNEWENKCEIIEREIRENQEKTNALFEIYRNEGRFRHIKKQQNETVDQYIQRKQSITDQYRVCHGKIIEYIVFLKHRRNIFKKGSTPQDNEKRLVVLATWKQLWQDARSLRSSLCERMATPPSTTINYKHGDVVTRPVGDEEAEGDRSWDISCNKLENAVKENMEKAKDLFEPFVVENRENFMHRRKNETLDEYVARKKTISEKQFVCDGNLLDYIAFLKEKRKISKKEKEVISISWNKIWESIATLKTTIELDDWDSKYIELENTIKINQEKIDNLSNQYEIRKNLKYNEKILINLISLKKARTEFKKKKEEKERKDVLETWKKLWAEAKILKDIITVKYGAVRPERSEIAEGDTWMNLCNQLEDSVKENQKKTDELFTNQDRVRYTPKQSDETNEEYDSRRMSIEEGRMISGGNLLEYIAFLKQERLKSQFIWTEKARAKRYRRKQNKINK